MDTIMADSNDTGRQIQLKIEIEEKHLKVTKFTYPPNKTLGMKYNMQMIQIPEHTLDKFGQFLNELHNGQLQSLDQDYNTSGHLVMIRMKHENWKAKATISLVKTASGMERMVTIISRSNQFESFKSHGCSSTSFIKHTCELKKTTSITHASEMRKTNIANQRPWSLNKN